MIDISDFVGSWRSSSFARYGANPWQITSQAVDLIRFRLPRLGKLDQHPSPLL
jgi:hypothetical protein